MVLTCGCQHRHVTSAIVTESEVLPHHDRRHPKLSDQEFINELLRRLNGALRSEGHHAGGLHTAGREELEFGGEVRQLQRCIVWPEQ